MDENVVHQNHQWSLLTFCFQSCWLFVLWCLRCICIPSSKPGCGVSFTHFVLVLRLFFTLKSIEKCKKWFLNIVWECRQSIDRLCLVVAFASVNVYSFSDHRTMFDYVAVHCRLLINTKRHCMISKLILKSMLNSRKPANSPGWTWTPTKTSIALKCIYRTLRKWWKSEWMRIISILVFELIFLFWNSIISVFAISLPSCRFWLVRYRPMLRLFMAKFSHPIWPTHKISLSFRPIFAIGENDSVTHTMTNRAGIFTSPSKN